MEQASLAETTMQEKYDQQEDYNEPAEYIPYQPSRDVLSNFRHIESLEAKSAIALTMAQDFQQKVSKDVA